MWRRVEKWGGVGSRAGGDRQSVGVGCRWGGPEVGGAGCSGGSVGVGRGGRGGVGG